MVSKDNWMAGLNRLPLVHERMAKDAPASAREFFGFHKRTRGFNKRALWLGRARAHACAQTLPLKTGIAHDCPACIFISRPFGHVDQK
jgi:hypothetical protein